MIEAAAAAGATINEPVEPGEETIDGIRYVFDVYVDAVDYLATAQGIYGNSDDGEAFSAAMIDAYPDRAGANLLSSRN